MACSRFVNNISFVIFALLVAACSASISTSKKPEVKIISLKDALTALEAKATQWYPDAYLIEADLPIQINQGPLWLISADFQSPTHDNESFNAKLRLDQTITTQVFQQSIAVYQTQPITLGNILIDSQPALNALLDNNDWQFINEHSPQCSSLSLKRDLAHSDEPIIWILSVWGCANPPPPKYTFLNLATGETGPLYP